MAAAVLSVTYKDLWSLGNTSFVPQLPSSGENVKLRQPKITLTVQQCRAKRNGETARVDAIRVYGLVNKGEGVLPVDDHLVIFDGETLIISDGVISKG